MKNLEKNIYINRKAIVLRYFNLIKHLLKHLNVINSFDFIKVY